MLKLAAGADLPEREISDAAACQRNGTVLEYRLRVWRHDADIRVVGQRKAGADSDVSGDLCLRHLRDLSDRCIHHPETKGNLR